MFATINEEVFSSLKVTPTAPGNAFRCTERRDRKV
jgi:hypothetical protein